MSYEIGKGRPPVHTRFKPGVSGDPSGKKKGVKNTKAVINEAIGLLALTPEQIKFKNNDTKSVLGLIIMRAVRDAIDGDKDARRDIFNIVKPAISYGADLTANSILREDEYQSLKMLLVREDEQ